MSGNTCIVLKYIIALGTTNFTPLSVRKQWTHHNRRTKLSYGNPIPSVLLQYKLSAPS